MNKNWGIYILAIFLAFYLIFYAGHCDSFEGLWYDPSPDPWHVSYPLHFDPDPTPWHDILNLQQGLNIGSIWGVNTVANNIRGGYGMGGMMGLNTGMFSSYGMIQQDGNYSMFFPQSSSGMMGLFGGATDNLPFNIPFYPTNYYDWFAENFRTLEPMSPYEINPERWRQGTRTVVIGGQIKILSPGVGAYAASPGIGGF
jgi:hypothetical protein